MLGIDYQRLNWGGKKGNKHANVRHEMKLSIKLTEMTFRIHFSLVSIHSNDLKRNADFFDISSERCSFPSSFAHGIPSTLCWIHSCLLGAPEKLITEKIIRFLSFFSSFLIFHVRPLIFFKYQIVGNFHDKNRVNTVQTIRVT